MTAGRFVKDKAAVLLVHLAGLFFLSFYLYVCGNTAAEIGLIALTWLAALCLWLWMEYRRRKRMFDQLFDLVKELEKPYLIAEVMENTSGLEDRLYRELLRSSNRSVMEKIHELENAGKDYKEYIESWVHEVKLPLTAAKLMCENETGHQNRGMLLQLDRIEKQVDQVLFYARMEHTYKDYRIHRVNLRETVVQAVTANKMYFLQKGMPVSVELPEEEPIFVSTDEKWVGFLLNQIFSNAMKYCREEGPTLRIYARTGSMQVSLVVEDNGIGIAAEDIGRVFEKGFTGKNGRKGKPSTGIGLYLCKSLCEKIGMGIVCESKEQEYTRIILTFPESNLSKL